jgi:hypothetical protein
MTPGKGGVKKERDPVWALEGREGGREGGRACSRRYHVFMPFVVFLPDDRFRAFSIEWLRHNVKSNWFLFGFQSLILFLPLFPAWSLRSSTMKSTARPISSPLRPWTRTITWQRRQTWMITLPKSKRAVSMIGYQLKKEKLPWYSGANRMGNWK